MKTVTLILLLLALISCTSRDNTNTFTDPRDGQTYKTVEIGNQVWMAENLAYLPELTIPSSGRFTNSSSSSPRYYVHGFSLGGTVKTAKASDKYKKYGVLYNWSAAIGACPDGWHLPSTYEWWELTDYLGGDSIAGGKLKERGIKQWNSPNMAATNETGFSALPGDALYSNKSFQAIGYVGYWWSATEENKLNAICKRMHHDDSNVVGRKYEKHSGHSVRCVKDYQGSLTAAELNERGITKSDLKDYYGAISDFSKALEVNPLYVNSYINRAAMKIHLQHNDYALTDLNKAVELNRLNSTAFANRAAVKIRLEDFKGAINDYNRAIKLDPDFAAYYIGGRGLAKYYLEDFRGALSDYDKAIELDPSRGESYFNRGLTKTDLKDYRGALSDFNKSYNLGYDDSEKLYYYRGLTKYDLNEYEEAITDLTKAIELDPQNPEYYYWRGACQISLENYHAGCQDLNNARDLGLSEANEMIRKYCNN